MGLNKPYKPTLCRNVGKNDENGEEMAKLLGFFRGFVYWTGMANLLLGFEEKTSTTTGKSCQSSGPVKTRSFLRHTSTYPLHIGTLLYP